MPIISPTDARTWRGRAAIGLIYLLLGLGSFTMVVPFLITLTGSLSTDFDYERRSPLPRFLWSRSDRLLRTLCTYFPPSHRGSLQQLRSFFPSLPADWQIWAQIGDERDAADAWAREQLARIDDPVELARLEAVTKDYGEFLVSWTVRETVLAYDRRFVATFLRRHYGTLDALNAAWEISIDDVFKVSANEWSGEPIDQHSYVPLVDRRYEDLLAFRRAYLGHHYSEFLKGPWDQANYLRPAALAYVWEEFAGQGLGIEDSRELRRLPFPVPADADPSLVSVWHAFLRAQFPLRHVRIAVTGPRQEEFRRFMVERFRNLDYLNRVMRDEDPNWETVSAWDRIALTGTVPDGPVSKVWMDFVDTQVPTTQWTVRETLPELAFQQFALDRYGSLSGINRAYGRGLMSLEELRLPFGEALLVSFRHHQWGYTWAQMTSSYRAVADHLFRRGTAVRNTVILVVLTVLITLTINPMAGYALSRFRLPQTEKILVFCLATMAFPTAVAAIPGFLLLRDLGLLNTFAALVLPGAANGMTIFLLKGFFDSLPQDLFEAATIDGAPEWRIFLSISLPLVKPILAVSALHAFLLAYNGWAWAIIVCQDPRIWTMAVWTYQFYQTTGDQPYTVMAAFIANSLPVFLVFLFCQKIILRGIILPQMK
ncbi:MAG: ABC transporter permease subunit [Lentisphaeria bacterium]|nr:ABC transporter permease subunit [Lentisphaeria bacterium]